MYIFGVQELQVDGFYLPTVILVKQVGNNKRLSAGQTARTNETRSVQSSENLTLKLC